MGREPLSRRRGMQNGHKKRALSAVAILALTGISVFSPAGPLVSTAEASPKTPITSNLDVNLPKGVNTVKVGDPDRKEVVSWKGFVEGKGNIADLGDGGTFVRFDGEQSYGVCGDHYMRGQDGGGEWKVFAGASDFPISGHQRPFAVDNSKLAIYKALSMMWQSESKVDYGVAYKYQHAVWGAQGAVRPTGEVADLLAQATEKAKDMQSNQDVLESLKAVIEDAPNGNKIVKIAGSDEAKRALNDADSSASKLVITVNDGAPVEGSVADAMKKGISVPLRVAPGSKHGTMKVAFDAKMKLAGLIAVLDGSSQPKVVFNPKVVSVRGEATAEVTGAELKPNLRTKAIDKADGDNVLPPEGGTVTDRVWYKDLVPGTEYVLSGELMDKSTGKSTGIKSSINFTPKGAAGEVKINFTVGSDLAGKSLVVFESLATKAAPDVVVAAHKDINAASQTVGVEASKPSPTPTPSAPSAPKPTPKPSKPTVDRLPQTGSPVSEAMVGIAAGLVGLGALALYGAKRGRRS